MSCKRGQRGKAGGNVDIEVFSSGVGDGGFGVRVFLLPAPMFKARKRKHFAYPFLSYGKNILNVFQMFLA